MCRRPPLFKFGYNAQKKKRKVRFVVRGGRVKRLRYLVSKEIETKTCPLHSIQGRIQGYRV
jgi:hypothetical protein